MFPVEVKTPGNALTHIQTLRVVSAYIQSFRSDLIPKSPGGGCAYSELSSTSQALGIDCTVIGGVSDVSCIQGECVVHKCMPGYEIGDHHSECIFAEDKNSEILAAQYGLEHSPF